MENDKQRVIDMLNRQINNCRSAIDKLDLSNTDKRTKAWRDKRWYEKSIEQNQRTINQILNKVN